MDSTTTGNARVDTIDSWYAFLPPNRYRAIAYPAGVPSSMDSATVIPATMTLRPSAAGTPWESQKKLIVAVDQCGHSDFGYW